MSLSRKRRLRANTECCHSCFHRCGNVAETCRLAARNNPVPMVACGAIAMPCFAASAATKLGDAGVTHLGLQNGDGPGIETIAHLICRVPLLARRDGHRALTRH